MSGSKIQVEKGNFTRIHNNVLELLAGGDFTGSELKLLIHLLRQTYGFRRKSAAISIGEFVEATGLGRSNVTRCLKALAGRSVIMCENGGGRGHKTVWAFNKYYEEWENSPLEGTVSELNSPAEGTVSELNSPLEGTVSSPLEGTVYISAKEKERKEEEAASPARPDNFKKFVKDYERVWGMMVPSATVADEIADWCGRITAEAWAYALKEAADHNARGHWAYLRKILQRLERTGYVPPEKKPKEVVDWDKIQF